MSAVMIDYTETPGTEYVTDTFGSYWAKCDPECDLEVVRPGKVQCGGLCDTLEGYWPEEDEWYADEVFYDDER